MATKDITTDAGTDALLPVGGIDGADVDLLGEVQVESFTAQPSSIMPFGGGSTLRWRVSTPAPRVKIYLAGRAVASSGTMLVHPTTSTSYVLTARAGRASAQLGSVAVRVDTSACITATIPESVLRDRLRQAIDAIDQASDDFKQRAPASVEVDANGIHVGLRLVLSVNNFVDPDVDVDFVLGLRVRDGAIEAFVKSFAVDVDWPWWVTVLSAGVSKIVEEFLDGRIERGLKPLILAKVKEQIDAFVRQLPRGMRLHAVVLRQDAIAVTACPTGPDMPFVVVAKSDLPLN